jgi:polyisoprenoid-binding protein YceI
MMKKQIFSLAILTTAIFSGLNAFPQKGNISEGTVIMKNGELAGGSFVIDLNSIVNLDLESEAWNKKLIDHLKSEDFFYVEKYPLSTFTITHIEKQESDNYKITGNLNLRGITREITFTANVVVEDGTVKAATPVIVLDRTQWKIETMSKSIVADLKDNYVDDEMQVQIDLVAQK